MLLFPKTGIVFTKAVRDEVAARLKITDPPTLKSVDALRNIYKQTTLDVASKLDQLLVIDKKRRMHIGKGGETQDVQDGQHLLAALDILLEANKVMVVAGKNTATGRVQPNGAVAAALFMDVLNRVKKVPVLVSDEINYKLTRCLLTPINPQCARYAAHETFHAVNGELVRQLADAIQTHQPDAAIFIGIPGRNSVKNYVDGSGNHLEEFNVAFDQALELCHRVELPTIAICSDASHAGMANISFSSKEEKNDTARTIMGAQCTVFAEDVAMGAVALSELIARAYLEDSICDAAGLEELIKSANKKTEDAAFKARQVRHTFRHRHQKEAPPTAMKPDSYVTKLKEFKQAIDKGELVWAQDGVEHFRAYGPEVKYLVLYDSSDGALIAMKDFLGYLNARSPFVFDTTIVTDHAKASYGDRGCELFTVVVDGIHYAAKLNADGIVMLCNTACSKSLQKAIEIVRLKLGKDIPVEVINLIETTAEAIVKYGGECPVILSTQGTAENGAYQAAVENAAKKLGVPVPKLTVVACGDRKNPLYNGFDLARIINEGYLENPNSNNGMMSLNAMRHYCSHVPVNATAVFMCCTHFPALRDQIAKIIGEYWAPLGRTGQVPLIDPVKYQADKTAHFLVTSVSEKKREHRQPLADNKHFLPKVEVHTTTGNTDKVRNAVNKYSKDMDVLNEYLKADISNVEDFSDEDNAQHGTEKPPKAPDNETEGIRVTRVHFEKVPLKELAAAVGVNEFGDEIKKDESVPAS
ncbi:glutamate cyclase domain-containing protein [Noviherbaspirillum pedocola]|uniref:Aspartate/glutamate racemase family protein n=1 Tax=Noviherbaspirillum pedocola TaxID=2801341 RepID=A0A934SX23_9BURK|nr:glutamate cyclase domain-containing protein [Noviherbaspirillum pedocola]MBK4736940.1 aspartate/glutamate racemase family protein [Noviherbaspirillum pedocola]